MTWQTIAPPAYAITIKGAPPIRVSIGAAGVNKAGRPLIRYLNISVRPTQIEGLTWWKPGARVTISLGAGEHAGRVRIAPTDGAGHAICKSSGSNNKDKTMSVRIQYPLGIDDQAHISPAVSYDWAAEFLEVELPEWARGVCVSGTPEAKPAIAAAVPDTAMAAALARAQRSNRTIPQPIVDRIKEADKKFSALSEKEKGYLNAQVSNLLSPKEVDREGKIAVTTEYAVRWGAERGLGPTPDLEMINAKREDLGLAPFRYDNGRAG